MRNLVVLLLIFSAHFAYSAPVLPLSYNFSGQLTDSTTGSAIALPVILKISVYNPAQTCLLYEETDNVDLSASNGYFSIAVGSGTRTSGAGADPGLAMSTVFSNSAAMSGASSCSYTPTSGDGRVLVATIMSVNSVALSTPDVLSPINIASVPFATSADSLQGVDKTGFVNVTASTTQARADTVFGNAAFLAWLGTVSNFSNIMLKSSNGTDALPTFSTAPTSPAQGQLWYDTTANAVKFYDGTTTQTVSTGSAAPGAPVGTYYKVAIDAGGRVVSGSSAAALVEADIPMLTLANKVQGSAITGTIAGSTAINTSGNITTTGTITGGTVTGTNLNGRNVLYFDSGSNAVTLKATTPATSVYTLTLPPSLPGSNQYLMTDSSGNLSWNTPAGGGSLTVVSSANSDISVANGTTTPTLTLNSGTAANQIVKLNGSAQLPAVDGSQLTNLNAANLNSGTIGAARMPALTGDVTSTAGTTTTKVTAIQNTGVSVTTPVTDQMLIYNGGSYSPAYVGLGDLRGTVSPSVNFAFPNATCAAGQILQWSVATGNFTCQAISVPDSQITYASQSAKTFFAAPNGAAGSPTYRTIVESDLPNLVTAGKVDGGAITSGTIGGSTSMTSTGNVWVSALKSQQHVVYDTGNVNSVTITAPTNTGYNFILPNTLGASGYVLTSAGPGSPMTWTAPRRRRHSHKRFFKQQ